jgi:hypothetical protein
MASRTNLSSKSVTIHTSEVLGRGTFRIAFAGTYIGGNRNQQEAVCKRFHDYYADLESEFFASDFQVADKAIEMAEHWNGFCQRGEEILITRGDVMSIGGRRYMVEPLIRYFVKFTSNNGFIASNQELGWAASAMEAFSHFTYHKSGGSMIVCDLQGRHRNDRNDRARRRFELTDVAICSRRRLYGPTDLGEKGIESFFANHKCNGFCKGGWARPRTARHWFVASSQTSMLASSCDHMLQTTNRTTFNATLQPIQDNDYDSDAESEEDEYVPMRYY